MGLDCFASRSPDDIVLTEEDEQAFEKAGIELCGGMYSGGGGSFRGKVYWDTVYDLTEVSLSDNLTPAEVRELSERLDAATPERVAEVLAASGNVESEVEELRRFFRLCAERGLGMIAWA